MANLGETAIIARKAIKYGGIGLVVLMVGRVVLSMSVTYWKKLHPPPPPPPDVKFGKLPKLVFPQKDQPSLEYTLETRTGGLPTKMVNQFAVYFMPIRKPNLLAYDKAKEVAGRMGFIQEPVKLSETDYRFNLTDPLPASLTINIITGAFVLDRKWQDDPTFLIPNMYYNDSQTVDRITNFLARVSLLPEDVKEGDHTAQYLRSENGQLVPAASLSQSFFVRINLYRKPIGETKVVNPRSDKGIISGILAMQREDVKQFVYIDYSYFPVDLETLAVYPLISVADAWERMQKGGGFVVAVKDDSQPVVVREIYLAYYDSDIPQQFMQPVYVFEGDNEFVGYVPAIADAWVE